MLGHGSKVSPERDSEEPDPGKDIPRINMMNGQRGFVSPMGFVQFVTSPRNKSGFIEADVRRFERSPLALQFKPQHLKQIRLSSSIFAQLLVQLKYQLNQHELDDSVD